MNNIYQPIIFESQNKDIRIEFTKEKVNRTFSFAKSDQEDRYIYTLVFKDILGTIIKVINLSDCEMYILLDNIYNFLYNKSETMTVSLSCKDATGQFLIFTIDTIIEDPELFAEYDKHQFSFMTSTIRKNIFKIYQHFNDTLVSILSFEISNSIPDLANSIYQICIQGLDLDKLDSEITATNIGTLIKPDFLL